MNTTGRRLSAGIVGGGFGAGLGKAHRDGMRLDAPSLPGSGFRRDLTGNPPAVRRTGDAAPAQAGV
jgi:hypothetical protein